MQSNALNERVLFGALTFVALCLALLVALSHVSTSPVASAEVYFTDSSKSGLHIMPASCASVAGWYHDLLTITSDHKGYIAPSGISERGASIDEVFLCVTNTSGRSYFVPAATVAEFQSFKNLGQTTIPGLLVY